MANGVKFFPNISGTIGGGGGGVIGNMNTVTTGALTAGVSKSVATGMLYTHYTFIVRDATNLADVNIIMTDPALPLTNFLIQSGVDLPGGLTVDVIGW